MVMVYRDFVCLFGWVLKMGVKMGWKCVGLCGKLLCLNELLDVCGVRLK